LVESQRFESWLGILGFGGIVRKGIFVGGAALLLVAGIYVTARAQGKQSRPSPPAKADCTFADGGTIAVDYSSPRMKGRDVWANPGPAPAGEIWRAGANEATTFVPSKDVHIGGMDVPAGSYTMFAIPYPDKPWTLIISKKTGEWGIPYPGEKEELGRVHMALNQLPEPMENFTIAFTKAGDDAYLMHIEWAKADAYVKIMEKK
jgi:hypothetical protein